MEAEIRYILVYVTCPDSAEAERLAEAALAERLAACANILDGMRSLYWWQGKLERGQECVLLFKSEARLFERLKDKITALHSYDTPCVVRLPIDGGHGPYLDWISDSVARK